MLGVTAVVERALAKVARPLVLAWSGVEEEALRPSWRAAAIRRAERLRGAYRDLAASSVPGGAEYVALCGELGIDPKNPRTGEALLTRAISPAGAFLPERGAELEQALSLDWLVPVATGWTSRLPARVEVRFGRDGEFFAGGGPKPDSRRSLRGRALVCFDGEVGAMPGGSRQAPDPGNGSRRDLVVVAFLPVADRGGERVARTVRGSEELMRAGADFADLAAIATGD
jgi:hypothetical protein